MWQRTRLPTALSATTFVALCGVAIAVAWAGWRRHVDLVSPGALPTTATAPSGESPAASAAQRAMALARLPEVALFGSPAAPDAPQAVAQPADEAELPEAAASFQIFGLIDATQAGRARAILGSSDADQREYRVGDEAPDGARVHAIRPRALVLERDGRLELVKLPEAGSGAASGEVPPVRLRFMPRPVARLAPPSASGGTTVGQDIAMPASGEPPPDAR